MAMMVEMADSRCRFRRLSAKQHRLGFVKSMACIKSSIAVFCKALLLNRQDAKSAKKKKHMPTKIVDFGRG